MSNQAFSKIWIIVILVILVGGGIFAWQYFGAPENEVTKDKEAKASRNICKEEGTNDVILKAISRKYPGSQILEADAKFDLARGPHWLVKIRAANREVVTEIFKCHDIYLIEQCNIESLRAHQRYISGGEPKYDQFRMDRCYSEVAGFYKNIELCKRIADEHVKNNCFAFIAGLRASNRWTPSICENLTDEEAKSGCIKFFEED